MDGGFITASNQSRMIGSWTRANLLGGLVAVAVMVAKVVAVEPSSSLDLEILSCCDRLSKATSSFLGVVSISFKPAPIEVRILWIEMRSFLIPTRLELMPLTASNTSSKEAWRWGCC